MTDEALMIECAKLDGWKDIGIGTVGSLHHPKCDCFSGEGCIKPSYLTFRDAIIPVIEKQGWDMNGWQNFLNILDEETNTSCSSLRLRNRIEGFKATPKQLAIALVRATGNWRE